MRFVRIVVAGLLMLGGAALAGPNEGIFLAVHAGGRGIETNGNPGATLPVPDNCEDFVPTVDGGPGVQWFTVLAVSTQCNPSFNTVTFGLGQDSANCYVAAAVPARPEFSPMEIPSDEWPEPNSGTCVSWAPNCLTNPIEPIYYIGFYSYGPGTIELGDFYPGQPAGVVDCSLPPVADAFEDFGVVGHGGSAGSNPYCPPGGNFPPRPLEAPPQPGFPEGDTLSVTVGEELDYTVGFCDVATNQTIHIDGHTEEEELSNFTFDDPIDGNPATLRFTFKPVWPQIGSHVVHFTATDDGALRSGRVPPAQTQEELTLVVLEPKGSPRNPPIGRSTKHIRHDNWDGDSAFDTVILSTGEYYLSATDLKIPGRGFDFEFNRTYRSQKGISPERFPFEKTGQLGAGWDFNYNMRLKCEMEGDPASCDVEFSYIYYDGAGRSDVYKVTGSSSGPPPGYYDEFEVIVPSHEAVITKKDSTQYFFKRLESEAWLRIERIVDRHGNQMQFFYSLADPLGAQLDSIVDTRGKTISFFYNGDGTLHQIMDLSGRIVTYEYDPDPQRKHLLKVTSPVVTYPGNQFSGGKGVSYEYDTVNIDARRHNLLRIKDDLDVVFLENTYDDRDRVVSHRYGEDDGEHLYTFEYFDYPSGEPENHILTREIDRNGNITEWLMNVNFRDDLDYNAGHVVEKTEYVELVPDSLVPLTTTYEYSKYGEKLKEILPRGNIIEYEYDWSNEDPRQQGNLLEVRRLCGSLCDEPETLRTVYTYETRFNQVRTETDPRGNTTTNRFDYEEATAGDLNNDGITTGAVGDLIRIEYPVTTLPAGADSAGYQPMQRMQYNQYGQPTKTIEPEGNAVAREYYDEAHEDVGYLRRIILDPDGIACETTYDYDAMGNIIQETDGFDRPTDYVVNELNQVQGIIRREVTLSTTLLEDSVTVRDTTFYHYDGQNNVEWRKLSNISDSAMVRPPIYTVFEHDLLTNVVQKEQQVDVDSFIVTTYEYDDNENLIRTTLPEGNSTCREYDQRDLAICRRQGCGTSIEAVMEWLYDENGNEHEIHTGDALEKITHKLYDGFDRHISTIDADSSAVAKTLDGNGNPIEDTRWDKTGTILARTINTYDELNRLIVEAIDHFDENGDPIGDGVARTVNHLDKNSRLARVVDDNAHETTYEYDNLNRRVLTRDNLGNTLESSYDCNDNTIMVTETELGPGGPFVYVTKYEYDELERLRKATDPLGHVREKTYDSRDNVGWEVDALGNRTHNSYDDLDRLVRVDRELRVGGTGDGGIDTSNPVNPDGLMTTRIEYDGNSNVVARIQDDNGICPDGCRIEFEYDALDRLTSETFPATPEHGITTRSYAYDDDNNIVQMTDQNGTIVDNTYDLLNRLTDVMVTRVPGVMGTTVQRYEYDGLSRMTLAYDNNDPADDSLVVNDDHTCRWQYDSMSNTREELQEYHNATYTVYSGHDGVGFRTRLTYANSREILFTPDELDRIKTICDGVGPCLGLDRIAECTYVGPVRLSKRVLGNGTSTEIDYDGDRRITEIRHVTPTPGIYINRITYQYDDEDNRIQKIQYRREPTIGRRPLRWDYVYDSAYRLIKEWDASAWITVQSHRNTYGYDGVGNRTLSIVEQDTSLYVADAMNQYVDISGGARTHDKNGNLTSDPLRTFSYDFGNRLTSLEQDGEATRYTYDARGRRVSKVTDLGGASELTVRYLCDGSEVIEERDETGQLLASYVYSTTIDDAIRMDRGNEAYHYHSDVLGTITHVTNQLGRVIETYRYDAFGNLQVTNGRGQLQDGTQIGNPITYTGRWNDDESRLYYYRARYYDPESGRFLARDPKGFVDGMNLYAYVRNNPPAFRDPLGGQATSDKEKRPPDPSQASAPKQKTEEKKEGEKDTEKVDPSILKADIEKKTEESEKIKTISDLLERCESEDEKTKNEAKKALVDLMNDDPDALIELCRRSRSGELGPAVSAAFQIALPEALERLALNGKATELIKDEELREMLWVTVQKTEKKLDKELDQIARTKPKSNFGPLEGKYYDVLILKVRLIRDSYDRLSSLKQDIEKARAREAKERGRNRKE